MKVSQKKTCSGCRCLDDGVSPHCLLGFNNRGKFNVSIAMAEATPQEPCPKPKTYTEYFEAMTNIRFKKPKGRKR